MIDTHCHINDSKYSLKVEEIVNLCIKNGITKLICSGADEESSISSVEISNKFECVYSTVGVHPDYCSSYNGKLEKEFQDLIVNNKKIVAVGEIGLDYHERQDNKEEQKQCFIKQIDLANRNNLPITIHTREATQDTLNILKEHKVLMGGVVHCFSGSIETAKEYISLGYYLGIGGVLTFKNAKNLIEVVKSVGIDNIVLETDSPYLCPEPHRGELNYPYYVSYVAKKISELLNIEYEKIIEKTDFNAKKVYFRSKND